MKQSSASIGDPFFEPGSEPFTGQVCLHGTRVAAGVYDASLVALGEVRTAKIVVVE